MPCLGVVFRSRHVHLDRLNGSRFTHLLVSSDRKDAAIHPVDGSLKNQGRHAMPRGRLSESSRPPRPAQRITLHAFVGILRSERRRHSPGRRFPEKSGPSCHASGSSFGVVTSTSTGSTDHASRICWYPQIGKTPPFTRSTVP